MDTAVKQGGTNRWILGSLCRGSDKHGAQQNKKVIIFRYPRGVTTDLHDTEWNEKVLIFRDPRGVTTDLLDV